jgi:hypothetical protein
MRQAIFVVVMVGAAFLGGATVNGPGLRWVQARLLDYMGLRDGGEIASVDLAQAHSEPVDPHREGTDPRASQLSSQTQAPGKENQTVKRDSTGSVESTSSRAGLLQAPSAGAPPPLPLPTMIPEPAVAKPSSSHSKLPQLQAESLNELTGHTSGTKMGIQAAGQNSEPPLLLSGSLEQPKMAERAASMTGESKPTSNSGSNPAPLDPSVGTALLASRSPSSSQTGRAPQTTPASIPLETSPSSPPLSAAVSGSQRSEERGVHIVGASPDWTQLCRKLRALGVIRYMVDGEPGGRVIFSCLVPVAGRQAVSQRFEAEGDDESQAAQAAIRRITLWRATRPSTSASP